MAEAVESEKVELRSLVDEAYTQVPILKEGISHVNEMSQQLTELNNKLEQDINDAFDAIARMINNRKDELLRQLKHTEACKVRTDNTVLSHRPCIKINYSARALKGITLSYLSTCSVIYFWENISNIFLNGNFRFPIRL